MMANLPQLALRQGLRYGRSVPARGSGVRTSFGAAQRDQVVASAKDFTFLYGQTLGLLESNMTVRAPRLRRHSATDMRAYADE